MYCAELDRSTSFICTRKGDFGYIPIYLCTRKGDFGYSHIYPYIGEMVVKGIYQTEDIDSIISVLLFSIGNSRFINNSINRTFI